MLDVDTCIVVLVYTQEEQLHLRFGCVASTSYQSQKNDSSEYRPDFFAVFSMPGTLMVTV
jgi:hypothetical protein